MLIAAVSSLALLWSAGPSMVATLQTIVDVDTDTSIEATRPRDGPDGQPAAEAAALAPNAGDTAPTSSVPAASEQPPVDTLAGASDEADTAALAFAEEAETTLSENPIATPEPTPLVTTPEASGQSDVASPAPENWPEILDAARTALAATETAQGRFYQTNPDGSIMVGDFALNRPGKLRFDYDDPVPVLIVADGTTVAIEDSELETVDRVPLAVTPLGIILDREVDFDGDVEVLNVRRMAGRIGIEMRDAAGEMEGTLTLIFDAESYALLGWVALDGNFQSTLVNLEEVETGVRLDPRLFRLIEAEDEEDER